MAKARGGLAILSLLAVSVGSTVGSAENASWCSLTWAEVLETFGPESGWALAAPPVPLLPGDNGTPAYQAVVFESREESRMTLIIAEWGDAASPDLGQLVYCTIHDCDGRVLDEAGRNPLEATADPQSCADCA